VHIPELVAHRGYALHYPENTLIGIEAAIRAGARFVEVDVQLGADKVPVLFHDRTLDRLCRAKGMIHRYTREQLKAFHVFEFERFGYKFAQNPITTLAELGALLARHPQVTAFIELKRVSIEVFGVQAVLDNVLRSLAPVLSQCVLISYNVPVLAAARKQGYQRVGAILERWHHRRNADVQAIHPDYLFCDAVDLPRFGDLEKAGAKIVVYEVTDPQVALKLAKRGVSFIETFAIGEMLAAFEPLRAQKA
jgi:glycerophosphoryl diester phosphodiesterase